MVDGESLSPREGSDRSLRAISVGATTMSGLSGGGVLGCALAASGSGQQTCGSQFVCRKCTMKFPLSDASSSKPETCNVCVASYKSLTVRWTSNRKLRTWWQDMDSSGQIAWFKKQHERPSGSKRKWDEFEYEDKTTESAHQNENEMDHWITFETYETDKLLRKWQPAEIDRGWKEEVDKAGADALYRRGEWLIPRFEGVMRMNGWQRQDSSSTRRSAKIENGEQLEGLVSAGRRLRQHFREQCRGPRSCTESSPKPHVDADPNDLPQVPEAQPVFAKQVTREANLVSRERQFEHQLHLQDLADATAYNENKSEVDSDKGSCAMANLKATSKISEAKLKVQDVMKEKLDKLVELKKLVANIFSEDGIVGTAVAGVRDELEEHKVLASEYWNGLIQQLDALPAQLEGNVSIAVAKKAVLDSGAIAKQATLGACKTLSTKMNILARHIREKEMAQKTAAALAKAADGANRQVEQPKVAAPPIAAVLKEIIEQGQAATPSTSAFEAKGGIRAAVVQLSSPGSVPAFEVLPVTKKASKDIRVHLRSETRGMITVPAGPNEKKIAKFCKLNFDQCLLTKLALPEASWAHQVYAFQYYGFLEGFVNIGYTHFCCAEVQYLMKGECIFVGIMPEKVPGATLKDKRKHLFMSSYDILLPMINPSGWAVALEAGQAIVIPSGCIVVTVAVADCFGLRWSLSSDSADTERVRTALVEVFDSFPEVRNPSSGYSQFHDCVCT